MKKHTIAAAIIATAIGVSFNAVAQGRHDEKPHASKPAAAASEKSTVASTGGRHDEGATTHGARKAPPKKEKAPANEAR